MIFFSNLTTRIADVEIQLLGLNVKRNVMTGLSFADLKAFYDNTHKEMGKGLKQSAKGRAIREEEEDALYEKALSGDLDTDITLDMSPTEKMIRTLGWNPIRFAYEWRSNDSLMGLEDFKQSHRSSKRMGERMLVMSGHPWNPKSHAPERDWNNINGAVTLETAIVLSYRHDLIMSCPGVRALRKEMEEFFLTIATPYFYKHPTTGKLDRKLEWSFPDGIECDEESSTGPSKPKSYDPDQQRKELAKANPSAGMKPQIKRTTVKFTVETLEKNPFLWCYEPEVATGTLETLAHHCINTLAQVRSPVIPRI
jgi:hypothetical protein